MQNATSARPRFRQDLVAELIEEGGQRFIDVADPDSGHIFRFFEVEYSLACAMDGERDVAGIVKWAQEELGLTPSAKEVQTVILTLSDLHFIGTDRTVDEAATKMASARANELAGGVVVGKQANANAGAEVELGRAGSNTPPPREERLPAADFALGASGAASSAMAQRKAAVEDIALGAPGVAETRAAKGAPHATSSPDMSLDLSEHLAIKPGDVKEAVRQSKVMSAVEVPKELLEAEAATPAKAPVKAEPAKGAEKAPAAKHAEPVKAKEPAKQPELAKHAEPVKTKEPAKQPEPAKHAEPVKAKEPEKKAAKPAVSLPKQPVVEKNPVVPPAPSSGVSPILISILILVVIGAGAFFVWKFVINKPDDMAQAPPPPKKPPPPPPPAEVTSKIVMETPAAMEIKAGIAGAIETIEAADKDVKTGDPIATLAGAKPLQAEIDKLAAEIEKLQPAVTAAEKELSDAQQKENNQAGVTAAQAKLDKAKKPLTDKQTAQKTKQAELDKLAVKSTGDGKLAEPAKVGDQVTADQVIAKVARPTAPVATFKIPAGTKIAADGTLSIQAGDKTVVCTVSDAQTETVKVTCPADQGLADGADVKFKLPK